jgi:hypothetical protein
LSNSGEDSLGFNMEGGSVQCNYVPRDVGFNVFKNGGAFLDIRQAV